MSSAAPRKFVLPLILIFAGLVVAGRAADPEVATRDVLVYKDGDRVQGQVVEQSGNLLVFKSDRFGVLRVPADSVVVIKAEKPPAPAVAATAPAPSAAGAEKKRAEQAEAEKVSRWGVLSPAALTARLRAYFGPWHGRLAFSTEIVSDTADRSTLSVEGRLSRKWKTDEVQLNGRYDYSATNDLTTTDMVKADALWRHDFTKNGFAQYRPTLEWNQANFRNGAPADYVLLQQEIGAGLTLSTKPTRKVRVGVSENLFNVWNISPPTSQSSRTVESAFVETELRLPWGLLLTDRGVFYYSFSSQTDGWENRVELNKKFSETLSTAIRHEIRRGSPDGTAQDYTRLRLLLGLDF